MKHSLFLSMMAAALLGGQVFAEPDVYRVSEAEDGAQITCSVSGTMIIVDAQKNLEALEALFSNCLTLDYQGEFVLTASWYIDTPDEGVLNITTTVDSVATAWEDAFSVEGGGSITLCHAEDYINGDYGPVQFFGTDANNTVQLGDTEVKFMGFVDALSDLAMNQVGVVWGDEDITLVGKLQKSVPEPTTGTLSLLALVALAARRRRK